MLTDAQPFLAIFIPAAKHLQGFAQGPVFRPTAAMEVTIQTSVAIKVGDEKAISIPPTFLVEHDGRSFLKFRPTGYQIVQLVCGSDISKNSSLANSISLDQLLKKRNHEWLKPSCGQDVFQEADQKPQRKRKHITNPELITIDVNGQAVECLMQGQRPIKSDLAIPLVPEQLQAVLNYVAQDAKEALTTRRAYKRIKNAPTPKRANGEDQEGDHADE